MCCLAPRNCTKLCGSKLLPALWILYFSVLSEYAPWTCGAQGRKTCRATAFLRVTALCQPEHGWDGLVVAAIMADDQFNRLARTMWANT